MYFLLFWYLYINATRWVVHLFSQTIKKSAFWLQPDFFISFLLFAAWNSGGIPAVLQSDCRVSSPTRLYLFIYLSPLDISLICLFNFSLIESDVLPKRQNENTTLEIFVNIFKMAPNRFPLSVRPSALCEFLCNLAEAGARQRSVWVKANIRRFAAPRFIFWPFDIVWVFQV